ncbi:aminotransferase class I/II-fold pyridoxal phosphate-dependent enzyme [Gordonia sp. TBRC 11910]|uniref:Aminotransferase n=1 Tax=Gordonia asplenii TaxID=2725283 RepID=A0A848KNZ8_9ACTN|nr:aminotransferase class I/II-fold pyridoxal phosphate-dependent enzyme [Gordonia asplenii]NMO00020.1 aminotransferase class I/II-fold pyridoxal phosphate-dependent enzyme [Gordonia asplenii]
MSVSSKQFQISQRAQRVAPFQAMEFAKHADAMEATGRHVTRLNIGEPDFGAPPEFLRTVRELADGRPTPYTPSVGIGELRSAIAEHYRAVDGLDVDPRRVCVTAGASAALLLCAAALIDPGDRVLVADPSYPCNRQFAESFGADVALLATSAATRFQLDAASVIAAWDSDTRGVMLASPSNPTGTSLAATELTKICAAVAERGGWRIVDEIYLGLTHDAGARSVLTVDDDAIVVNSFSKVFGLTGWRLGWCVVPDVMVPVIEKLAQNYYICPSTPAQYAAVTCFEPATLQLAQDRRRRIVERKEIVLQALSEMGLPVPVAPDGAFYVYVDVSGTGLTSWEFCEQALERARVSLTPGHDFGVTGAERFVRLSYAIAPDDLRAGLRRLADFVADQPTKPAPTS